MEKGPEKNYTELKNPQILYVWRAPLRPYMKRNKQVFRFYLALSLLTSLIIFFLGDRILLIPIWTLFFLFYVFTVTPPPEVENKISRFGIETAGATLRWEELSYFYFSHRLGYEILTVVSREPYFYHFYLVVPNHEVRQKLIGLLTQHIIYQENPQKTITDKIIDSFLKLIPEEETTKSGA